MNSNIIRFNTPAEETIYGWENYSLYVGNGFLGASVFSGVEKECIAISEHTLSLPPAHYMGMVAKEHQKPLECAGNECFEKIYLEFEHKEFTDYERTLNLETGIVTLKYISGSVEYTRKAFASYPDRCFVFELSASEKGALSFSLKAIAPYTRDYLYEENDHMGRTGKTTVKGNETKVDGVSEYFNIEYEGLLRVYSDGEILSSGDHIKVENATNAHLILAVGTNFELCEDVNPEDRLNVLKGNESPHGKVKAILDNAEKYTYSQLLERHLNDFSTLYNRVKIDFGGKDDNECTDKLIEKYRNGENIPYLEELHFNVGRYLLISSSRIGGLPSALQGIWNFHQVPPWTNGYWYNINIQMNYWAAFTCNLAECFVPYNEFNQKRMKAFQKLADEYILKNHSENYEEGKNGWIVGTGNGVLYIGDVGGHSGPGTGGLTTQAYMDWYDFTLDKEILKKYAYPIFEGMARFYMKCIKEIDGKFLATCSFSPEQFHNGKPYETIGCAFDQQMIYENNKSFLRICELLDYEDVDMKLVEKVKYQIDKYEPVIIGKSGQIKEYREEEYYGDIGEKDHRHISQLCGLYPGNIINATTKDWLDAAKITLQMRGFTSGVGWSKAHKALMFARALCGNEAYTVLSDVIKCNTFPNMWGKHYEEGIFQIDGSFGATAAYAEMLMQSNSGYIDIFPALPDITKNVSFEGLCARGGFEVSAMRKDEKVAIKIKSLKGQKATLRYKNISKAKGTFEIINDDMITFPTETGKTYEFKLFSEIYI